MVLPRPRATRHPPAVRSEETSIPALELPHQAVIVEAAGGRPRGRRLSAISTRPGPRERSLLPVHPLELPDEVIVVVSRRGLWRPSLRLVPGPAALFGLPFHLLVAAPHPLEDLLVPRRLVGMVDERPSPVPGPDGRPIEVEQLVSRVYDAGLLEDAGAAHLYNIKGAENVRVRGRAAGVCRMAVPQKEPGVRAKSWYW